MAAAYIVPDKVVIGLGEPGQAPVGVGHQHLRGVKDLTGLQHPAEPGIMDAHYRPDGSCLIQFNVRFVVAGVDQHHAIALAIVLGGFRLAENDEGIVLMTGSTPGGGNGLDTLDQIPALRHPLHGVPSVEVDQLPASEGNIQAGRGGLFQHHHAVSGIDNPNGPGDHIFCFKNAVQQLHQHPCGSILQGDAQAADAAAKMCFAAAVAPDPRDTFNNLCRFY